MVWGGKLQEEEASQSRPMEAWEVLSDEERAVPGRLSCMCKGPEVRETKEHSRNYNTIGQNSWSTKCRCHRGAEEMGRRKSMDQIVPPFMQSVGKQEVSTFFL